MKAAAQVVVIGGGITGRATARHLARRGLGGVVLLGRSELASGSTRHAAGGPHGLDGASSRAALRGHSIGLHAAPLARGRQVRRRLCGHVVEAGGPGPVGSEPVLADGRMAPAAHGHRIGQAVALAVLPAEGAGVSVRVLGRGHPARVTLGPPYDPAGQRLRVGPPPVAPKLEAAE
jgi:glycine/D-amino acid oxidase-like deaminating enzyme